MLYPLKFNPLYKDYIWGGRELEKLNKKLPDGIVAESWEVSTHADGEGSISNGEYKDEKLSSLVKLLGKALIGEALPKKDLEKFPLLVKLIDANDRLSVQVHPKDEYAKLHENGEYGKNEMWYIIDAKPGAKIVYGVKAGVTRESFAKAVELDKIEECLNYMEVKAGDSVNIPAGLVHAIGKGIIIAEIQQNSNTTYRVFDYNRTDKEGHRRQLHIEKALQVIDFDNCNTTGKLKGKKTQISEAFTKEVLVANEYFTVEDLLIDGKANELANGSRFLIYVCISGEGCINYKGGSEKIAMGESVLIPANLGEFYIEGKLQLIKAYV